MLNWLPWKIITKHFAKSQGFIDPLGVYARLQNFSQPSEVAEPIELLRAGVIMHARGLVNSRAIQHNLDWVWPYWVEKQFDPNDDSFVPRAFSITHINLTHRNWTATGIPDSEELPIVDPRGLLTPFWDSWSIDAWFLPQEGEALIPSRSKVCKQSQNYSDAALFISTEFGEKNVELESVSSVISKENQLLANLDISVQSKSSGWLVVCLRPYNPEGISFIDSLQQQSDKAGWLVNGKQEVLFDQAPDRHHSSNYKNGDVFIHLRDRVNDSGTQCNVGLVTAAAMFATQANTKKTVNVQVPLGSANSNPSEHSATTRTDSSSSRELRSSELWADALSEKAVLNIPDRKMTDLYEAAVRTLVLNTPGDIFAGPFTYKRFWYRDAVFIAHGLLSSGMISRARKIIDRLPAGQKRNGYFHSQEGEWDSNGQVLWLYRRYLELSNTTEEIYPWSVIENGANWIIKKRSQKNISEWQGLMPAGFSAEHLGPNDYYYWDDYWSVAGLEAAAWVAATLGKTHAEKKYSQEAKSMRQHIENSLKVTEKRFNQNAIPAAAGRRMDAGAIGSVVASYPLQYYRPNNSALLNTVEYLLDNCFFENGFFQDMIHSGVNAYLSLHVAQALLRAGDHRYFPIVKAMADIASPTGHWPEAVHPRTKGGCMGDGHHTWAAAEWAAMMKTLFIREEADELIVGSGIPGHWLVAGQECSYGPAPTTYGPATVNIFPVNFSSGFSSEPGVSRPKTADTRSYPTTVKVSLQAAWHTTPPKVTVALPGYASKSVDKPEKDIEFVLQRE